MTKDDVSYWAHALAGILITAFIWMLVPASCKTTDAGIGRDVQQSAEQLGELREQNRQLTERVERESELRGKLRDAIIRAETDAASAGDDVRGAIKLLTEYKRRVDEYFAAANNLEGEAGGSTQMGSRAIDRVDIEAMRDDYRLRSVREGN